MFNNTNESEKQKNISDSQSNFKKQTIVYENVSIEKYKSGLPFIHDILTNNTNKTIVSIEESMLSFDKSGKPLKVDWLSIDSSSKPSYYFLYDWGT